MLDSSPVSSASSRWQRAEAHVEHRNEIFERQRHAHAGLRRRRTEHDAMCARIEFDRRSGEKVGAEHDVVAEATDIVQHDVIRRRQRHTAERERSRAHDLGCVIAQAAHLKRADRRQAQAFGERQSDREPGVPESSRQRAAMPAIAHGNDRNRTLGIGRDR